MNISLLCDIMPCVSVTTSVTTFERASCLSLQDSRKSPPATSKKEASSSSEVVVSMYPSIHIWHYSPFRTLAPLTRHLHSIYGTTAPSGPWPPSQDTSIPYMALQPLPDLGPPHKTPPFHIWRYSPFRALAPLTRHLHSIYGATAPSGPWPPPQDTSIHIWRYSPF